jgi:hypothetical protein
MGRPSGLVLFARRLTVDGGNADVYINGVKKSDDMSFWDTQTEEDGGFQTYDGLTVGVLNTVRVVMNGNSNQPPGPVGYRGRIWSIWTF